MGKGKNICVEELDRILFARACGDSAANIAKKLDRSSVSVKTVLDIFDKARDNDIEALAEMVASKHIGQNVVQWAFTRQEKPFPSELEKAFYEKKVARAAEHARNKAQPVVQEAPKEEPDPVQGRGGVVARAVRDRLEIDVYMDGKRIGHAFAKLREDIPSDEMRYAQALSYATHMVFKRIQAENAEKGLFFDYQFRGRNKGEEVRNGNG